MAVSLVWLRRDLRLADNPALVEAVRSGRPVLFLFNLDSERLNRHDVDGIHIQWELDCLNQFRIDVEKRGGAVLFRFGPVLSLSMNYTNFTESKPSTAMRSLVCSGLGIVTSKSQNGVYTMILNSLNSRQTVLSGDWRQGMIGRRCVIEE